MVQLRGIEYTAISVQRFRNRSSTTIEVDTEVVTRLDTEEDNRLERPWLVIVWNDPINLMNYVTYVFQKLFGYSLAKATKLMLDVHQKGRAVVASGTRERAEFDVSRLHRHGLWATMEQAG
jgi:ATP-dependent Clp protease adaptor protein ClpS